MADPWKSIELPEDLQAFAEERVRAGEYASVRDVATAALRLLQREGELRKAAIHELGELFSEMERGVRLEPTDDEFGWAVHERALKHMGR